MPVGRDVPCGIIPPFTAGVSGLCIPSLTSCFASPPLPRSAAPVVFPLGDGNTSRFVLVLVAVLVCLRAGVPKAETAAAAAAVAHWVLLTDAALYVIETRGGGGGAGGKSTATTAAGTDAARNHAAGMEAAAPSLTSVTGPAGRF